MRLTNHRSSSSQTCDVHHSHGLPKRHCIRTLPYTWAKLYNRVTQLPIWTQNHSGDSVLSGSDPLCPQISGVLVPAQSASPRTTWCGTTLRNKPQCYSILIIYKLQATFQILNRGDLRWPRVADRTFKSSYYLNRGETCLSHFKTVLTGH